MPFLVIFLSLFLESAAAAGGYNPDYVEALAKSILFFEGQRSGRLPPNQRMTWRMDSALSDGSLQHVDLVGGYYDAGDNVKFNFPMAYTTTMLSWGVLEYGRKLKSESQLERAREAIRWATDYFLKCASDLPEKLYVGVGDPSEDHNCWERPEDMDTVRSVYYVTREKPGSDVAGEMAAALAAASLVFRRADRSYSLRLLECAKKVFRFAAKYQGSYQNSVGIDACPYYCSYSGYKDELLWGAAWLLRATNNGAYYRFIKNQEDGELPDLFSWDNKYSGAYVLLSRWALLGKHKGFDEYRQHAEHFMCSILPNSLSSISSTNYTQGGLMFKLPEYNLQYVTSATFLMTTYAKYMALTKTKLSCGSHNFLVTHNTLRNLAKKQVDYILGENPIGMSYMVGFGSKYPEMIHHRGSSLPSKVEERNRFSCKEGFESFYESSNPNPNILFGAIVGGPTQSDTFQDDRKDFSHTEPTTYTNAAIVGPLAYLAARYRS